MKTPNLDIVRDIRYHPAMKDLIRQFNLPPHPEGDFFREIYRSTHTIWSDAVSDIRAAFTHIYFLLTKEQVRRFHRVAHDEIWHTYQGDPPHLIQFDKSNLKETLPAKALVDEYDVICFEDLNLKTMQRLWGRQLSDLGLYSFFESIRVLLPAGRI